ncbi:MAG: xanthine dehydrogenase family protein molybdopterin-binding subunit, partial [Alphaproteobacteria bacterium]|nr:xanthine dehydrogenase family protein molybdopterin-binding subunit [Alphaproteobacteria bacterium]
MGEFALGQPVPRFEDPRLLRGGGRYVDDMVLPRMVFGNVLRSPHAHARIRSIDTSAAKAAPGVLAVLTGADWEASGWRDLPTAAGNRRRDGSSAYRPPYPALVKDRVRWVGDYVAFVVAETRHQAADAAELIQVEYEPMPAVVSTEDATKPDAPLVWDEAPDNISFVYLEGDKAAADTAFSGAAHIVRRKFVINRVTAATMEPRGAIGDYNAAERHYTIYTTLQRTHGYRAELSQILRVPESRVRVVAGDIGGSFGMKSAIYPEVALVLLASKLLGRPVKWTSTRSEAFLGDAQARDNVTEAELALDGEGNFLGLRVKTIAAVGAYPQAGSNAFVNNLGTLAGVYRTPAVYADVTAVYTHTNPMRAYRGNGRPEAAYVIERMVDDAAAELGIDAVELRRRNTIAPESMPFKSGLTFTYDCGEFEKCLDMALELADARGFESRRAEARRHGRLRGLGIANTIERAAAGGFEAAEIRFDRSGTVTLLSGSITQGQGHETVYKQLLCDRLGLHPDQVHYVQGDTEKVAIGEGTGGSRSASLGGSAVHLATEKIVGKGKAIAGRILGADAEEVRFEDGLFSAPRSNRTLTVGEIAKESLNPENLPGDMDLGLIAGATFACKEQNFPNGCHICELEIDEETGEVEILRYSVVDDVGT